VIAFTAASKSITHDAENEQLKPSSAMSRIYIIVMCLFDILLNRFDIFISLVFYELEVSYLI